MSATNARMLRHDLEPAPHGRLTRWLRTPKSTLAVLLLCLLALAGSSVGWRLVLPHLAAALAGAGLVDLVITRQRRHAWLWPSSALLSGLIVAFILAPEEPWSVTLAVGALASVSKQLVRTRRGHVFNPAALALLASIPVFATAQSWWGALADMQGAWLFLLLAGGAFMVDRLNKFPLVLSFLAAYFGLFMLVGLVDPTAVAEMFRAPFVHAAVFFACFMLTDPPTAPAGYIEQLWIGPLIAVVSCTAQLIGAGQAYLFVGLLAANGALVIRRQASTRPPAPQVPLSQPAGYVWRPPSERAARAEGAWRTRAGTRASR